MDNGSRDPRIGAKAAEAQRHYDETHGSVAMTPNTGQYIRGDTKDRDIVRNPADEISTAANRLLNDVRYFAEASARRGALLARVLDHLAAMGPFDHNHVARMCRLAGDIRMEISPGQTQTSAEVDR